ncbi:MAG: hypothetical protein A2Y10_05280 [Planctomycetes bacterium GWF2_41_51]|nr:MAG: hypothetical protein A2Y10_05280 [Planctomycetes bacterium GWF2_41_51]HBG25524.1 hypothetical protein [Phycisphaerales bacterium]
MANTSAENLSQEIEDLKKDIGRLQKDFTSKLETVSATSKEKLMETKERVKEAIDSLRNQISQKASGAYDNIKEHSNVALDKSRQTIGEKPVTAVMVAFFAGALVGLFSHKCK